MVESTTPESAARQDHVNALQAEVHQFFTRDTDAIQRDVLMHGRWLSGKGGVCANFEFRDLSVMDLKGVLLDSVRMTGVNLAKADLRGASLKQAVLIGADLEEADLRDADLKDADLRGANLHRALLTGATLHGADLSCHGVDVSDDRSSVEGSPTILTDANLGRAILCQAKLVGCDLSGAELVDADLSGADMTGSIMLGVDLSGANLRDSILYEAVLDFSAHDPATVAAIAAIGGAVAPTYRHLSVEDFVAAIRDHEQWAESAGNLGKRLDIERTKIPCVKMTGRNLAGSRVRRCLVDRGEWIEMKLGMADFSYTNLSGIVLRRSDLRGITLRRAVLTGADFTAANLDAHPLVGDRTWPSNLEGAILRDAILTDASFGGAILRRVDFTGCLIHGATMRGADLEGARR